jgi:hypothetical protein
MSADSHNVEEVKPPAPKTGTCGHPALFTWHFSGYQRVQPCLYCQRDQYLADHTGCGCEPTCKTCVARGFT